jgi:hypothetical protein
VTRAEARVLALGWLRRHRFVPSDAAMPSELVDSLADELLAAAHPEETPTKPDLEVERRR